jgi:hypothetical protein
VAKRKQALPYIIGAVTVAVLLIAGVAMLVSSSRDTGRKGAAQRTTDTKPAAGETKKRSPSGHNRKAADYEEQDESPLAREQRFIEEGRKRDAEFSKRREKEDEENERREAERLARADVEYEGRKEDEERKFSITP